MRRILLFIVTIILFWLLTRLCYEWPSIVKNNALASKIDSVTLWRNAQLGASYTVLGAAFSGAALVGVLVTLWMQVSNADKQEQLRRSDEFERGFFRRVDAWRNFTSRVRKTKTGDETTIFEGIQAFQDIYDGITHSAFLTPNLTNNSEAVVVLQRNEYIEVFAKSIAHDILAPYWRLLFRIFKYVDLDKRVIDKKEYTSLVRAELSLTELNLLALNCLTETGSPFIEYLEKYHLFEHMRQEKHDIRPMLEKVKAFHPSVFYSEKMPPSVSSKVWEPKGI